MSRTRATLGIKEVNIKRDHRRLTVKQECQEETIEMRSDLSLTIGIILIFIRR